MVLSKYIIGFLLVGEWGSVVWSKICSPSLLLWYDYLSTSRGCQTHSVLCFGEVKGHKNDDERKIKLASL